jgi:hypothetical protein
MALNPSAPFRNFVWSDEGHNTKFSVSFPTAPDMDLNLLGAELYNGMEEHDVLVLHFKGKPFIKREPLVSMDPVIFTVTAPDKTVMTWNGYIHHIKQVNTHQGSNTDIVCGGASLLLKDTDQKIYKNVTADQIVSKIAAKHGMTAVVQRDPRVRNNVAQVGQTDWQVCKRLARQTGFALRADNTTIYFMSKDKIYQNKKASAPYFLYVDAEDTGAIPREVRALGNIVSFNPIISDDAPEQGIRVDRVVSGIHKATGTVIKTTHKHKVTNKTSAGAVRPSTEYFLK